MFGGLLAQLVWKKLGFTVVREIVELITTLTLTLLIMAAIGTMSLEFLSHNAPLFIMLYGAGVLWILFMFFFMAKRMFKNFWFQNAIVSFGQGMGMTATGLLFAQMVDPKNRTNAVEGFGYKQLMFEPLMGGGMVTALSMPIILLIGLPLFTAICAGVVVFGLLVFGRKR
jgi:ESS family glutamate:Na+ symporter